MADGFFFGYQILSVTVLIVRTTGLVPLRFQTLLRSLFGAALATAVSFILYSVIAKTTLVIDNRCAAIYHRQSNVIGKIIIFSIYSALLLVFTLPATKHIRASHRAGLGTTNTTSYLLKIIMSVSLRICLAIMGFLMTVILSFAGVWGNYFFIEFTVQNYFGITASTFDSSTDGASSSNGQSSATTLPAVSSVFSMDGIGKGRDGVERRTNTNLAIWDHPTSTGGGGGGSSGTSKTKRGGREGPWGGEDDVSLEELGGIRENRR
ncbi:hypothetical protein HDU67_004429 [Dinochytrium kinnereticum]|nr:hypothetical protein HDU67_004429 [Dinochytrium kinnereticum]